MSGSKHGSGEGVPHLSDIAASSGVYDGAPQEQTALMIQETSPEALLKHLQTLIASQPEIPKVLPPPLSTSTATPLISPLPQQTILPLPPTSSKLPNQPLPLPALLTYLSNHILPNLNRPGLSPNYYGFVTGGATPAALLADWIVSLYDQNVQVHLPRETICTNVEVAALNQLIDLFHLPEETWGIGTSSDGTQRGGGGTFTTGATTSNILGLALGREFVIQRAAAVASSSSSSASPSRRADPSDSTNSVADLGLPAAMRLANLHTLCILSALPHSSIAKAASVVGIGRSQVISVLKPGTDVEIDLAAVERHASQPGVACILVVGAGEVNTGHFATNGRCWERLRALCDRLGVWVHVDAAFGLFARVLLGSSSGQNQDSGDKEDYEPLLQGVRGLELADSITGDAHKLLNVPYDCGMFFTRHRALCEQVFVNGGAAYLTPPATAAAGDGEGDGIQSPLNIGLENSRRFRALPVHATLMAYGREGYVDMLKRQIGLARRVVRWLCANPDAYDVVPAIRNADGDVDVEELVRRTFIIVLFRARDEAVNAQLVKRINASGRMYVSGTKWEGKPAARIAVSNWMADVQRDGKVIEEVLGGIVGK